MVTRPIPFFGSTDRPLRLAPDRRTTFAGPVGGRAAIAQRRRYRLAGVVVEPLALPLHRGDAGIGSESVSVNSILASANSRRG